MTISNKMKLTASQKEVLLALSKGNLIRYATYSRPNGVEYETVSIKDETYRDTNTPITKATFKKLYDSQLIEAQTGEGEETSQSQSQSQHDPFGVYYCISPAGKQAVEP